MKNSSRDGLEKIQEYTRQLETARLKLQKEREELRSLDSKLQLLREQEGDLSGYFRGVKAIIQASRGGKPVLAGIIGPVVDLIAVEKKYLRAVEISLGSGLQYMVTVTGEAARKAIGFLKEKNQGWATFLPLDMITVRPSSLDRHPGWREQEGALGKLAEFVKIDPGYSRIVDYLLGNVAVCRDLETASRVARIIKYSCQIISLQGEVINPGGSMRGGSLPKRSAGLLGRRHEIESLQKERNGFEQQQLQSTRQVNYFQEEIASLKISQEKTNRQLEEQQGRLAGLLKLDEELAQNRRFLEERLKAVKADRKAYQGEQATLITRLQASRQLALDYKLELADVRKDLEGEKELYEQGLLKKERLEKEVTGCLVNLSSFQEQKRSLAEKLAQAAGDKQRISREIEDQQAREEKISQIMQDNQAGQEKLCRQLEQQGKLLAVSTDQLKQKQEEVHRLRLELADLETEDQKWQERRQRLERRKQQLDLEQARLQAELKLWNLRYGELFGEMELAAPGPDFDTEQAEKRVEGLNGQLELLGEVNLGAIGELSRLEERITFLHGQLEDLRQGEQSLHKVLAEIDQHMTGYFTKTLDLINQNFIIVFGDLFGGGKAYLELTDPDHLLESGVEIIAQPPGKKLQSITLLSTGEKVLTALSLIFAILLHKPAPFYLLDEVESALDENNLGKFIAYLQRLSDQAQFILITHRKRTMDTADIIYGITMSEPGISKLVSIKNSEKDKAS